MEIYKICLALDKRDFRYFRVIGGVPARSETQVTLHHDCLLGTVVILQDNMLIEHSPSLPANEEIRSQSVSDFLTPSYRLFVNNFRYHTIVEITQTQVEGNSPVHNFWLACGVWNIIGGVERGDIIKIQ